MELKNFLKKEGISVKSLSNKTKIPYSTLNDLINGKTDIDNMRFGFVRNGGLTEPFPLHKKAHGRV